MTEAEADVAIPSLPYTDEDLVIVSGVQKEHESNVYGYISTMDYQVTHRPDHHCAAKSSQKCGFRMISLVSRMNIAQTIPNDGDGDLLSPRGVASAPG